MFPIKIEMLLLVHPRFFFWFMKQNIFGKKKKKKLFVVYIYIMNKDEERQCANLIPCKQLHNVV